MQKDHNSSKGFSIGSILWHPVEDEEESKVILSLDDNTIKLWDLEAGGSKAKEVGKINLGTILYMPSFHQHLILFPKASYIGSPKAVGIPITPMRWLLQMILVYRDGIFVLSSRFLML